MKKYTLATAIIILAISMPLFSEKVATLSDLTRPAILIVQNNNIYVLEGTTVWIYAL